MADQSDYEDYAALAASSPRPKSSRLIFKSSVLMRRIAALENAAINRSWKGSLPPEDHAKVERAYRKARLALVEYVVERVLP